MRENLNKVADGLRQANRIRAFISTIITSIVAGGIAGFTHFILASITPSGSGLEKLFWFPLLIILMIMNVCLVFATFVNSIIAIKNKNIVIKVISVILLIVSIALIVYVAYLGFMFQGLLAA